MRCVCARLVLINIFRLYRYTILNKTTEWSDVFCVMCFVFFFFHSGRIICLCKLTHSDYSSSQARLFVAFALYSARAQFFSNNSLRSLSLSRHKMTTIIIATIYSKYTKRLINIKIEIPDEIQGLCIGITKNRHYHLLFSIANSAVPHFVLALILFFFFVFISFWHLHLRFVRVSASASFSHI